MGVYLSNANAKKEKKKKEENGQLGQRLCGHCKDVWLFGLKDHLQEKITTDTSGYSVCVDRKHKKKKKPGKWEAKATSLRPL